MLRQLIAPRRHRGTEPIDSWIFAGNCRQRIAVCLRFSVVSLALLWPQVLAAASLESQVDGLLGGLATSISPLGVGDPRHVLPPELDQLSNALATFRTLAPVPTATGAFRFAWDADVGSFHRLRKGPGLADTAQTLGHRFGAVSLAYTRIDFDTLEGHSLGNLGSRQAAFSDAFLAGLPCDDPGDPGQCDSLRFDDDELVTQLDFEMSLDQFVIGAAYGLSDSVDVSVAVSLAYIDMSARAEARLYDPNKDGPPSFGSGFALDHPCAGDERSCAGDSFAADAFGTGDVYLRGKWRFATLAWADLAASGTLTIPTGNADDYLGFHGPTFTPLLIVSKDFARFSPHLNAGYSMRDGRDVGQALWIVGTDVRVLERLILAADFLGFHDDKRDSINDDVLQAALGFKVNVFRSAVLSANFQLPLNDDGLRADVIYTGQVEWTF